MGTGQATSSSHISTFRGGMGLEKSCIKWKKWVKMVYWSGLLPSISSCFLVQGFLQFCSVTLFGLPIKDTKVRWTRTFGGCDQKQQIVWRLAHKLHMRWMIGHRRHLLPRSWRCMIVIRYNTLIPMSKGLILQRFTAKWYWKRYRRRRI